MTQMCLTASSVGLSEITCSPCKWATGSGRRRLPVTWYGDPPAVTGVSAIGRCGFQLHRIWDGVSPWEKSELQREPWPDEEWFAERGAPKLGDMEG